MNTQFTYVDANNAYVVARSSNEHNVSASPSFINHASNYAQGPMQSNLHASNSYDFSNILTYLSKLSCIGNPTNPYADEQHDGFG